MKTVKLFTPFVIIFFACSHMLALIASFCQAKIIPYNQDLEGSRILFYRKELLSGNFPKDVDILFVGTSRTMADYNPQIFAETLANNVPLSNIPKAQNFGNLANYPTFFESYLESENVHPKLLVIEFSPHMFVISPEEAAKPNLYQDYRSMIQIQELAVNGWIKQILGLEDLGWLNPSSLFVISSAQSTRNLACGEKLDILRLNSYGYGQRLIEGGQVEYHVYLPNRQAAEYARPYFHTEYEAFKEVSLVGSFKYAEWEAYKRIIQNAASKDSVVVVRPAVDPALYSLENQQASQVIETVTQYLASQHIPYIDLNPHNYYSLDMSHIDWYDTSNLSKDLALKVIPLVDWQKFINTSR